MNAVHTYVIIQAKKYNQNVCQIVLISFALIRMEGNGTEDVLVNSTYEY